MERGTQIDGNARRLPTEWTILESLGCGWKQNRGAIQDDAVGGFGESAAQRARSAVQANQSSSLECSHTPQQVGVVRFPESQANQTSSAL